MRTDIAPPAGSHETGDGLSRVCAVSALDGSCTDAAALREAVRCEVEKLADSVVQPAAYVKAGRLVEQLASERVSDGRLLVTTVGDVLDRLRSRGGETFSPEGDDRDGSRARSALLFVHDSMGALLVQNPRPADGAAVDPAAPVVLSPVRWLPRVLNLFVADEGGHAPGLLPARTETPGVYFRDVVLGVFAHELLRSPDVVAGERVAARERTAEETRADAERVLEVLVGLELCIADRDVLIFPSAMLPVAPARQIEAWAAGWTPGAWRVVVGRVLALPGGLRFSPAIMPLMCARLRHSQPLRRLCASGVPLSFLEGGRFVCVSCLEWVAVVRCSSDFARFEVWVNASSPSTAASVLEAVRGVLGAAGTASVPDVEERGLCPGSLCRVDVTALDSVAALSLEAAGDVYHPAQVREGVWLQRLPAFEDRTASRRSPALDLTVHDDRCVWPPEEPRATAVASVATSSVVWSSSWRSGASDERRLVDAALNRLGVPSVLSDSGGGGLGSIAAGALEAVGGTSARRAERGASSLVPTVHELELAAEEAAVLLVERYAAQLEKLLDEGEAAKLGECAVRRIVLALDGEALKSAYEAEFRAGRSAGDLLSRLPSLVDVKLGRVGLSHVKLVTVGGEPEWNEDGLFFRAAARVGPSGPLYVHKARAGKNPLKYGETTDADDAEIRARGLVLA